MLFAFNTVAGRAAAGQCLQFIGTEAVQMRCVFKKKNKVKYSIKVKNISEIKE